MNKKHTYIIAGGAAALLGLAVTYYLITRKPEKDELN